MGRRYFFLVTLDILLGRTSVDDIFFGVTSLVKFQVPMNLDILLGSTSVEDIFSGVKLELNFKVSLNLDVLFGRTSVEDIFFGVTSVVKFTSKSGAIMIRLFSKKITLL